jgi:predicted transcriptional regulator
MTSTEPQFMSAGEWKVFRLLQSQPRPLSVAQLAKELARNDPDFSLSANTVKTVAERLHKKGYLLRDLGPSSRGRGREPFFYRPAVPLEAALRLHVHNFLDQFASGGESDLEIAQRVVEERRATLK